MLGMVPSQIANFGNLPYFSILIFQIFLFVFVKFKPIFILKHIKKKLKGFEAFFASHDGQF